MNYLSDVQISHWQKIFAFLIVTFPILDIYAIGVKGIGIGSTMISLALIVIFIRFLRSSQKVKWNLYYGFFLYGIIISLLNLFLHSEFSVADVFVRLTYFLFFTLIIFVPSERDFNVQYAGKLYLKIGILIGIYLIIQYIVFFIFKYTLIGLVPGLTLNYAITDYAEWMDKYNSMYEIIFRPTSIFPEPAALAQYLSPLLILILFTRIAGKWRILTAIFISVSMILSTSTNGIVLSAIIWGIFLFSRNYGGIDNKQIAVFLVPVVTLSIIFLFMTLLSANNPISDYTNQQLNDLFTMNTSSSAYLRILRGFDIYRQLDILEEIFGIGLGTYRSYYAMGSIYVLDGEVEYMSSLSYLLVCTGIFGFLNFIYSLFYNAKKRGMASKLLSIWLIIVFASSSLFNSPIYALTYLFILHGDLLNS